MKFYRYILLVTAFLMLVFLAGCAPEESDLTPPNAAFDGGVVTTPTASTTTFVSGTMDAGSTVSVYVTTSATVTGLTTSGVTWSFTLNGMVEGSNIVQVSVADAVGNSRTIQLTIVVDLTGPVTTIDQYPVIAKPGMFTFAGTVTESNSAVSVEVFDFGGVSKAGPVLVSADADIWSTNLDLSGILIGLLPEDFTVSATGIDRLGNVSTTPTTQLMTLDADSPAFVISTPALPIVLSTDVDLQDLTGTTSGSLLTVTPYATFTQPVAGDWTAKLSGLPGGETVVTFAVDDATLITEQKILVVRDQTAPIVVEWLSLPDTLINSLISIEFNESMNVATIESTNLTILDSNATVVNVLLPVTPNSDRKFTFETDLLDDDGTYTATLQTTDNFMVEDARGNSIAASYSWTFKKQ